MSKLVKLYNTTYQKYLSYLTNPTENGTYTVLMLNSDEVKDAKDLWEMVPVAQDVFTLLAPSLNAHLILLGDQNPNSPKGSAVAWLAKSSFMSPMEFKYDVDGEAIITNAGPVSQYLSALPNDPYAYFIATKIDEWEIYLL
ncbi:hypothetical protein [Ochrobactrum soli]|uniref:Uncharacterized protein n=1 Tax=Ochrobactrum soli TaxID=2448455 RepID=A0A849KRV4_9HYPH|nr:hypothetical protein [[Ochrobactrum] soli]NNU59606.1 hypothetical protein [[Ochrobactrum] soli]